MVEDILTVEGKEVFYAYQVENQVIVLPENIDMICTFLGGEPSAQVSIGQTNQALTVMQRFI